MDLPSGRKYLACMYMGMEKLADLRYDLLDTIDHSSQRDPLTRILLTLIPEYVSTVGNDTEKLTEYFRLLTERNTWTSDSEANRLLAHIREADQSDGNIHIVSAIGALALYGYYCLGMDMLDNLKNEAEAN